MSSPFIKELEFKPLKNIFYNQQTQLLSFTYCVELDLDGYKVSIYYIFCSEDSSVCLGKFLKMLYLHQPTPFLTTQLSPTFRFQDCWKPSFLQLIFFHHFKQDQLGILSGLTVIAEDWGSGGCRFKSRRCQNFFF